MPTHSQRLIWAVRNHRYEWLGELIRKGHDISSRSPAGRTALHAAAEEGDAEAIRLLIDAGADVNARMHNGLTPLHLAAADGGAVDLADPDTDRRNPCDCQKRSLNPQVAQAVADVLKESRPELPSDLGPFDDIPEEYAADVWSAAFDCFMDRERLYAEIVRRGIDIERLDPDFAEHLKGNPRFLGAVELLLDRGADVHAVDKYGSSVLRGAVELGKAKTVELLLRRGANPNDGAPADQSGQSLIALALERSKIDTADVLVRYGAKVEHQSPGILHEAASNGRETALVWLLDQGVDINGRDEEGNSPLLSAAGAGHDGNVNILIRRGADVLVRNHNGDGALHAAASWPACLKPLLAMRLPIDEVNGEGRTALHIAAGAGDFKSIRTLVEAGASAKIQDQAGNGPLHMLFLTDECRPDIEFPAFHALVCAGANRATKDEQGKTAFDVANERSYPEEFLKLLNPVEELPGSSFLWLGEESYAAFLPEAMWHFKLDGSVWPSAEHYFQAQKAESPELREHIRGAKTAEAAVCRLRESKFKPSAEWHSRCDGVMRTALFAKFKQNEELLKRLLATGDAILVSDSHCESYWMENPNAGFNAIGKMLMGIRSELSDDAARVGG